MRAQLGDTFMHMRIMCICECVFLVVVVITEVRLNCLWYITSHTVTDEVIALNNAGVN